MILCSIGPIGIYAQASDAQITVLSTSPARVRIDGKLYSATRAWSFRNAYAGLLGLGERIEDLRLTDASGLNVPVRKLAPGEYEAARDANGWSCEIRLQPPSTYGDAAHISWLADERGFLMLGDLLPLGDGSESGRAIRIRLDLPKSWSAFSNDAKRNDGQFDVMDAEDGVFFIGSSLRERHERIGGTAVSFLTEGAWAFSDEDVAIMVGRILKEYVNRLGVNPGTRAAVMLSHFPTAVGAERWSAETRGNTVVLLSGQSPSKVAGLAQLSTPLTHELFHLWVPNSLHLAGNYDWFYEGFTLYESLCIAVRLGFLTFQDYLVALGRAYDSYFATREGRKLSLIEASQRRWTGPTALVYQKGMLVAFLYDLTLRQLSQGKRSLDDVYRALFKETSKSNARREGNDVVLAVLKEQDKLQNLIQSYVENADEIDLKSVIAPFGLKVELAGARVRIVVSDKLTRRQRDLLRVFGYNDETRRTNN